MILPLPLFIYLFFCTVTSKTARNGEPIFNVFDGLLADIESLRTGPRDGEDYNEDDVYNTPEAARARIAVDVQALREEVCSNFNIILLLLFHYYYPYPFYYTLLFN